MNEHYAMINNRFDNRAGLLLSNGWQCRRGAIIDDVNGMKKANQAYFFSPKSGKVVNNSVVLYADDLVFNDMTKGG